MTRSVAEGMVLKTCSVCGEETLVKKGQGRRCRDCVNAYHRKWRAENRPQHRAAVEKYRTSEKGIRTRRAHHRVKTYGLDDATFQRLLAAQGHTCAICRVPFDQKRYQACVDHCHDTNHIRGLLCRTCNAALGGLKDDAVLVRNAVAYLQREDRDELIHPWALIGSAPEHRDYYADPDFKAHFPVIHETARINAFVTVDSGIKRATTVGARTLTMAHCHLGHDVIVGDDCELAPGTVIGGFCEIGNGVKIGVNACLRPYIRVGDGARIGAGSVVVKHVPAGELWAGNPARRLK